MDISVVIPTCNRKTRLLSLLQNLNNSILPVKEAIIVDSGEDRLNDADIAAFHDLDVKYILSEKSVCLQRNKGIAIARSEWIFLCDDDIEVPDDYLKILEQHIIDHPEAGAVSGSVLQKEKDKWVAHYVERSSLKLFWKYFFQLSGLRSLVRETKTNELMITGIHKYVRHPLYAGTFVFIWGLWVLLPSVALMISNFIITVYTLIGIGFEEKKLVNEFGEAYKKYMKEVPMIIPGFKL